jgi:hypothetical protein
LEYERDPSRRTQVRPEQLCELKGKWGEMKGLGLGDPKPQMLNQKDQKAKTGPIDGATMTEKVGTMNMSLSSPFTPKLGVIA